MKVDIQTLGTFNRLFHRGAEKATASLEQLTGIAPAVEATSVELATKESVVSEFSDRDLVGVTTEFDDALSGTALLVFDRAGAHTLVQNLPGGAPETADEIEQRITEIGNILISGFIDGWADYLDAAIDHSPPTSVHGSGDDVIPDDAPILDDSGQILAFKSVLETNTAAIDASVYLFPERSSFETVMEDQLTAGSTPIPLDKLRIFNHMTLEGANRASDNVTMMTGTETTVSVSRLRFLPIEDTVKQLGGDPYVGVTVELSGLPSGYLVILFDEESAAAVAEAMGAGPVDGSFESMHRSAIEEICNIMSSGFIDGWANVLGTSISHTPPEFVHDYASAITDPVVVQLATDQEYVFVFESLVETADRAITCEIFALPNESELKDALNALDIDEETVNEEEALATAMNANHEELF